MEIVLAALVAAAVSAGVVLAMGRARRPAAGGPVGAAVAPPRETVPRSDGDGDGAARGSPSSRWPWLTGRRWRTS